MIRTRKCIVTSQDAGPSLSHGGQRKMRPAYRDLIDLSEEVSTTSNNSTEDIKNLTEGDPSPRDGRPLKKYTGKVNGRTVTVYSSR